MVADESMRGPFGPKRLRDAGKEVPILKQKMDLPPMPEPTPDEPNPFPTGRGPEDAVKWLGSEIRGGFMALFGAMRDIDATLEASNPEKAIPHVPCVVPIRNTQTGESMGFGVYCIHCSYVKHRGDDQMVWCEEPTVDLSKWPPTRLVPAPEFVEESPGATDG